ncbi:ribonuclease H-like domain-containing protein [Mycena sanguinolenta]|nr:ribonuclease H-like domain-containing protein [Mycena sanguinolenta]
MSPEEWLKHATLPENTISGKPEGMKQHLLSCHVLGLTRSNRNRKYSVLRWKLTLLEKVVTNILKNGLRDLQPSMVINAATAYILHSSLKNCKLYPRKSEFRLLLNPEFKQFFNKYIPGTTLPDWCTLSSRREASEVVARAQLETNGKLAMYVEDGWNNIAKTHVDTSMITVETKARLLLMLSILNIQHCRFQPFLLHTHDMTVCPKTGDELYKIVIDDLAYAEETYGVDIIAVCTDDGPDGSLDGGGKTGHQDHKVFQSPPDPAEKLMLGHFLALFLPVLTCWLSNYTAVRRLERLQAQIQIVILVNEDKIRYCLDRKPEQIAEAKIAAHLEPLGIASKILQALYCRLDMVLLTFGNLFCIFGALPAGDSAITEAVRSSLERCWGKTDQELMILTVFLNPFIRTCPFNLDIFLPMFFHLVVRMYERLLRKDPAGDTDFANAFNDYHNNKGHFSDSSMALDWHEQAYIKTVGIWNFFLFCRCSLFRKGVAPDVVSIWRFMAGNTQSLTGQAGLIALAVHVLSILPNSTGPERAFSEFGMIHTKRRNRLAPEKVHKTSLVRQTARLTTQIATPPPDSINLAQQEDADGGSKDDNPAVDALASTQ